MIYEHFLRFVKCSTAVCFDKRDTESTPPLYPDTARILQQESEEKLQVSLKP